jgi:hypothetical protein
MSTPITGCLIGRAIVSKAARAELDNRCRENMTKGAFSIWGCTHKPPCPRPDEEQMHEILMDCPNFLRLVAAISQSSAEKEPSFKPYPKCHES